MIGLKKPLAELAPRERSVSPLLDDIHGSMKKHLLEEVRCVYMRRTTFLETIVGRCRALNNLKLAPVFKSQESTKAIIDFQANLGVYMRKSSGMYVAGKITISSRPFCFR